MRVKDMKSVCSQKEAEIFRQRCFGRQLLLQLRLNQSRLQLNLQPPSKTILSSFSFGTVGKYLEGGLQLI